MAGTLIMTRPPPNEGNRKGPRTIAGILIVIGIGIFTSIRYGIGIGSILKMAAAPVETVGSLRHC